MKNTVIGFAVALGFALPTMAGPDATTRYLMNEPVSLLDLGVLRINSAMSEHENLTNFSLGYRFEQNEFVFRYTSFELLNVPRRIDLDEDATPEDQQAYLAAAAQERLTAMLACENAVDSIRDWFVNSDGSTLANYFFSHYGFERSPPNDLYSDLDKKFKIDVLLFVNYKGYLGAENIVSLSCTAPMIGVGFASQYLYADSEN